MKLSPLIVVLVAFFVVLQVSALVVTGVEADTTTIGVGSNPNGVGIDPTTDQIYVANFDSNSVSVIKGATNAVVTTIAVGTNPSGIAVDPTTDRIYVANGASNSVSVIKG